MWFFAVAMRNAVTRLPAPVTAATAGGTAEANKAAGSSTFLQSAEGPAWDSSGDMYIARVEPGAGRHHTDTAVFLVWYKSYLLNPSMASRSSAEGLNRRIARFVRNPEQAFSRRADRSKMAGVVNVAERAG
jgi:hypothetical protein